jgi:hypothetical protein
MGCRRIDLHVGQGGAEEGHSSVDIAVGTTVGQGGQYHMVGRVNGQLELGKVAVRDSLSAHEKLEAPASAEVSRAFLESIHDLFCFSDKYQENRDITVPNVG